MPSDNEKSHIMKSFPGKKNARNNLLLTLGAILVVLVGVGSGYLFSGRTVGVGRTATEKAAPGARKNGQEAGITDEATFSDSAEGILVKGGIEGEGTHHLDRDLGEDKYVYLTSTVIDLQGYVDKKVKVWGETISARHAGWLMDVGKIKVVE